MKTTGFMLVPRYRYKATGAWVFLGRTWIESCFTWSHADAFLSIRIEWKLGNERTKRTKHIHPSHGTLHNPETLPCFLASATYDRGKTSTAHGSRDGKTLVSYAQNTWHLTRQAMQPLIKKKISLSISLRGWSPYTNPHCVRFYWMFQSLPSHWFLWRDRNR